MSFQVAQACRSKAYNVAYQLYKNNEYNKAFKAFNQLYKNGCPTSPFFLGTFYTYGLATKPDYNKAINYFVKFLDNKNIVQSRDYRANAYRALALIYKTKGESKKAFGYLGDSVKLGNQEAMFYLGRSYVSNKEPYHVKTDFKKAYYWLSKVAKNGNIQAMKLIYDYGLQDKK